jgi:predicted porin
MAKGANVNKLAAEFADELDALGVRVAALEKKSDNVRITGNIRDRWRLDNSPGNGRHRMRHELRSRLFVNGQINDGWKYTGLMENIQNWRTDIGEDNDLRLSRAFVSGRIGGVKVELGRNDYELIGGESDVYSDLADGIKATYGDKFKISGWYGKPTAMNTATMGDPNDPLFVGDAYKVFAGARLSYDWDKFGVYAEYDKFSPKHALAFTNNNRGREIWGIGADAKFGDFTVNALFLHGKMKNSPNAATDKKNGWSLKVKYKGAKAANPGSWGIGAKYYDQGNLTYVIHGTMGAIPVGAANNGGFKGFAVLADYAVAKNIVTTIGYYDFKGKGPNANKARQYMAHAVFTF